MTSVRWIIAARPRLAAHSHCTFKPTAQKARSPSRLDLDRKSLCAACGYVESPGRKWVSATSPRSARTTPLPGCVPEDDNGTNCLWDFEWSEIIDRKVSW